MEPDIPSWLAPSPSVAQKAQMVTLPLEPLNAYEIVFERMLVAISSSGVTLADFVKEHHLRPDLVNFRSWVHRDPERQRRYYDARAIGAELVEEELLTIADALNDPMEDVQRSKLRIDTRKWVLGVWNKKRYGEVKQLDITSIQTVNIVDALAEARARVIDGTAYRVEDDNA